MFEAVAVGDLHLTDDSGKGALSKYVQQPNQMVLNEFQRVVDWARERHIVAVVQLGDVCDGPRMSYDAIIALSRFLQRNHDMLFYFILGNHDMYSENPDIGHSLEIMKLLSLPNVTFYTKPETVKLGGTPVRFLPYPNEDFDPAALNFFHKEVRGAKNDAGKSMNDDSLSASKAITVAGHLHTAQRVRNTFYTGTLYQTNFGEGLNKYFHHIRFRSPKDYEIELIPHKPKYTLHNVVINSRADVKKIPTEKTSLVKLVIQDGADVRADDYANYSNIVQIKNFKSRDDLQRVLTEDLQAAGAITFKTTDFFNAWIDNIEMPDQDREYVRALRERILQEAA